jgi:hypothetical protein
MNIECNVGNVKSYGLVLLGEFYTYYAPVDLGDYFDFFK